MAANRCFPSVVLHPKSLVAVVVNSSRVMGHGRFARRLAHVMNSSAVSAVMALGHFPFGTIVILRSPFPSHVSMILPPGGAILKLDAVTLPLVRAWISS